MGDQRLGGSQLFGRQLTTEGDVERLACTPFIADQEANPKLAEQIAHILYVPATNGLPASSCPDKCHRMTSSVTGRKLRSEQSPHFTRGFSQTPWTHSFAQAGACPAFPVRRLSNRRG